MSQSQVVVGQRVLTADSVRAVVVVSIDGDKVVCRNKYGVTGTFTRQELKPL